MHFVRGLVIKIFMQMPTQHHVSSSLVQYRNELVQDLGLPVPEKLKVILEQLHDREAPGDPTDNNTNDGQ